jgi:hypothetical protein
MRTNRLRSVAPSVARTIFSQFLHRVEGEGAHPVRKIGLGDRFLGLDRMHEAERRLRQGGRNQADLGDRGHVVMGHAGIPQYLEQVRRGIGLHRIERAARKLLDEESGGPMRGMRTNKRDRLSRVQPCDLGAGDAGRGGR